MNCVLCSMCYSGDVLCAMGYCYESLVMCMGCVSCVSCNVFYMRMVVCDHYYDVCCMNSYGCDLLWMCDELWGMSYGL